MSEITLRDGGHFEKPRGGMTEFEVQARAVEGSGLEYGGGEGGGAAQWGRVILVKVNSCGVEMWKYSLEEKGNGAFRSTH